MRVTTKGQVTIPGEVRKALGIRPGDEVAFNRKNGDFVLTKGPATKAELADFEAWLDAFTGSAEGGPYGTTDEALDDLRDRKA